MRMKSIRPAPVGLTPQRTCLGCREVKAKPELIRLVRVTGGSVEIDLDDKKAGRGAYLCRSPRCWEIGLKGGRLEHALRTTLSRDNRGRLIGFGENFVKEQVGGEDRWTR